MEKGTCEQCGKEDWLEDGLCDECYIKENVEYAIDEGAEKVLKKLRHLKEEEE
jgi:NMD protein affecting ribosome stability and mRNA decay